VSLASQSSSQPPSETPLGSLSESVASQSTERSRTGATTPLQSAASTGSIEIEDEQLNESTQSSQPDVILSSHPSPTSQITNDSSAAGKATGSQDIPSSQHSIATSHTTHTTHESTSTEEPGIITPELHPSRLLVNIEESDDNLSSTPPLSPDDQKSMAADTTFDAVDTDEDVFFNGHPASQSHEDWSMAKTDSEEEEDSEDDVPVIPRLLTYAAPTPVRPRVSLAGSIQITQANSQTPKRRAPIIQPAKGKGKSRSKAFDVFDGSKLPKTPQRKSKSDQSRCRSITEPLPLRSALKLAPTYEPPRLLQRPFFPNRISDTRRAGTVEPSSSGCLFAQRQSYASMVSEEGSSSTPLYLLANAASDAAEGQPGDDTWPRSGTLIDFGIQSQESSNPSSSFVAANNRSVSAPCIPPVHS
jgi:hypothetical protein